jgi:hypothetical protein
MVASGLLLENPSSTARYSFARPVPGRIQTCVEASIGQLSAFHACGLHGLDRSRSAHSSHPDAPCRTT